MSDTLPEPGSHVLDGYSKNYIKWADANDKEEGKFVVSDEDRLLARALANRMPGYFVYPHTDSIHEAIPYYLNALYDAHMLNEEMRRLRNGLPA